LKAGVYDVQMQQHNQLLAVRPTAAAVFVYFWVRGWLFGLFLAVFSLH
jgi:hypothetical protein